MKKLFAFLSVIAMFYSCDQQQYLLNPQYYSVQFAKPKQSVDEANVLVKIPVILVAPKQTSDVSIKYEIMGTAKNYSILNTPGTLTIKSGVFSDTIVVKVIRDKEVTGDREVTLSISSVSSGLAPGIGSQGKSFTLTIRDSDCPFVLDEGEYELNAAFEIDGFIFSSSIYPGQIIKNKVNLKRGTEPNTLIDSDFGLLSKDAIQPPRFSSVPVAIKFSKNIDGDYVTSLMGGHFDFQDGTSAEDVTVAYNAAPNRRVFTGNGPGTVSTCEKTFTVKALIRREAGSTAQIYTLVYTKK